MTQSLREFDDPTHGRARRILGAFFTIVGIVVALALIVGGFFFFRLWSTATDVERSQSLLPGGDRPAAVADGSLNYVLMGSDSRGEGDQGRSDVLMLAHVPPARDKIYVISFPRDMWVQIPGRGYDKINAAFAYGGEQLATRTLESLVGVRMDHAVKVDFEGFMGLTAELGGVTVVNRVASETRSDGQSYKWPRGKITIQGKEALAYVRQRYGLPHGDFDRAERQRALVKAILHEMIGRGTVTNPIPFDAAMRQVSKYVVVDEGLTNQVIFTTASSMRISGDDDIVQLQAPLERASRSPAGGWIALVNEPQLKEMAGAIRDGGMAGYAVKYAEQPFLPVP